MSVPPAICQESPRERGIMMDEWRRLLTTPKENCLCPISHLSRQPLVQKHNNTWSIKALFCSPILGWWHNLLFVSRNLALTNIFCWLPPPASGAVGSGKWPFKWRYQFHPMFSHPQSRASMDQWHVAVLGRPNLLPKRTNTGSGINISHRFGELCYCCS